MYKCIGRLFGVRPAKPSIALKQCIISAYEEAVARKAPQLSQSHCVLALAKSIARQDLRLPDRTAPISSERLQSRISERLSDGVKSGKSAEDPLPLSAELANLVVKYGAIADPETLLNMFLLNPDDVLVAVLTDNL